MLCSALAVSYCTWSVTVLTLPSSRVCNNSGRTRKRIIVSTRTRLRQALLGVRALQREPEGWSWWGLGKKFCSRSRKRKTGRGRGNAGAKREWEETGGRGRGKGVAKWGGMNEWMNEKSCEGLGKRTRGVCAVMSLSLSPSGIVGRCGDAEHQPNSCQQPYVMKLYPCHSERRECGGLPSETTRRASMQGRGWNPLSFSFAVRNRLRLARPKSINCVRTGSLCGGARSNATLALFVWLERLFQFQERLDGSVSNYNANYCKALTTVTFNRLCAALGISCHLGSEPSSLAVTYKRHVQEIEGQWRRNVQNNNPNYLMQLDWDCKLSFIRDSCSFNVCKLHMHF